MSGFNSAYPNWTNVDLTALANWSGDLTCDFVVDAFSPKYLGTGTTVNGWIVTAETPNAAILRITDIFGSPALTNQKSITVGSGYGAQMQFERGAQGWGIVVSSGGYGTIVYYTTDGTNWTEVTIDAYYDTYGQTWFCGLALDALTPGTAYISTLLASGASNTGSPPSGVIMKTTNYGASWSSTGISCGYMKAGAIIMPYSRSDVLFHGYRTGSSTSTYKLYRSVVGGASVDISPVVGSDVYGVDNNASNRQISIADDDPNVLMFVGTCNAASKRAVFLTRNALASAPTWTTLVAPVSVGSELYNGSYLSSRNYAILFGRAGNIGAWAGGSTVVSKQGDLSTSASVIGLCGG